MKNLPCFLQLEERIEIYCSSLVAATGRPGTEGSSELECVAGAIVSAGGGTYGAPWMSDPSVCVG